MTLVRDLHDRIDNEGRMRFDRWKIEHGFTDDPEWYDLPEGGPDRVRFYNDVLADETLSLVELRDNPAFGQMRESYQHVRNTEHDGWLPLDTLKLDGRQVLFLSPAGEFEAPALEMRPLSRSETVAAIKAGMGWPQKKFVPTHWKPLPAASPPQKDKTG